MKAQMLLMAGMLVMGTSANAQNNNPNSSAYHAIHNPQSPYYVGPQQQPAVQQPPRPTGYWEKTWGAIAPSPQGGVLGTALGARSKEEAERLALKDCKAKGGGACKVQIAYRNQCAVMIVGNKFLGTARAETIKKASDLGLRNCQVSDTNCRVYYSACTEPVFHKY